MKCAKILKIGYWFNTFANGCTRTFGKEISSTLNPAILNPVILLILISCLFLLFTLYPSQFKYLFFFRFKSKELEDKFNCFYNRLVETSNEESSEANTSKDDHALSTDRSTADERKTDSGKETVDTSLSEQPSEDFDSLQSPVNKEFPASALKVETSRLANLNYFSKM